VPKGLARQDDDDDDNDKVSLSSSSSTTRRKRTHAHGPGDVAREASLMLYDLLPNFLFDNVTSNDFLGFDVDSRCTSVLAHVRNLADDDIAAQLQFALTQFLTTTTTSSSSISSSVSSVSSCSSFVQENRAATSPFLSRRFVCLSFGSRDAYIYIYHHQKMDCRLFFCGGKGSFPCAVPFRFDVCPAPSKYPIYIYIYSLVIVVVVIVVCIVVVGRGRDIVSYMRCYGVPLT
jgi:hypothetical protein